MGKRADSKPRVGKAVKGDPPCARAMELDGWIPDYLENLRNTGRQLDSAKAAGVGFSTVWRRRLDFPDFVALEKQAMDAAKAIAEDELHRRAIEGVERVTYGKDGQITSQVREYSDTLLLRLLERLDPTWRTKTEINFSGEITFSTLSDRRAAIESARVAALRDRETQELPVIEGEVAESED